MTVAWLVEDDPADRVLLKLAMRSARVVRELSSLAEAEAALSQLEGPRPEVLLADLHLPDSAGLATLDRLLDAAVGIPVVVVTGDDVAAQKAVRVGAQDAITKDRIDDLDRVVRNAVDRVNQDHRHPMIRSSRFLDLTPDLLVVMDEDFIPIQINQTFTDVLGWTLYDLAYHGWRHMVHPEDLTDAQRTLKDFRRSKEVVRYEQRFLAADGNYRWIEWRVAVDEATGLFYSVGRDITDMATEREELRRQVRTDDLTGLPNRAALMEHLQTWLGRARPLSVFFCDLDGFKDVNDRWGHDAGDAVLVEVAVRLRPLLRRRADMLARYAGDEFVIVADRVSATEADGLVRRVMTEMSRPIPLGDDEAVLGLSMGVAERSSLLPDPAAIMSAADKALFVAKRAGRGQARRWGPDLRH